MGCPGDPEPQSVDAIECLVASRTFKESLPAPNCPPLDAIPPPARLLLRLVPAGPVTQQHFLSHNALGKWLPAGMDSCRWASCSALVSLEAAKRLAKLPTLAHMKEVVQFKVDEASGLSKQTGPHIDLWFFDQFDPLLSCELVASL